MKEVLPEKRITPDEYLRLAASISARDQHLSSISAEKCRLVVTGTVDLCGYPDKNKVRVLPSAEIIGDLRASNCPDLEWANCQVSASAYFGMSGLRDLGPNFRVGGLLEARECMQLRTLKGSFPGEVCLEGSAIEHLGKDFSCLGDLKVSRCSSLRSLDCSVGGSLQAMASSLSNLCRGFSCANHLHLAQCHSLKRLDRVKGPPCDVDLTQSGIEEISPKFICGGSLTLHDVPFLKKLGGESHYRLEVKHAPLLESVRFRCFHDMDFDHCESLRHVGFWASGKVVFHECGMDGFSSNTTSQGPLTVKHCRNFASLSGVWSSDVNLMFLGSLTKIDPDFRCGGDLGIWSCEKLVELKGRVGGDATLQSSTGLREIPSSFLTAGDLTLDCPRLNINSLGCCVGGNLTVNHCRSEFSTQNSLRVGGSAVFMGCLRMENLRGRVERDVNLQAGTGVRNVSAEFECGGNLLISSCPRLEVLNCRVGGAVRILDSSLKKTGPAFHCAGALEVSGKTELRELNGSAGGLLFSSSTQKLTDIQQKMNSPAAHAANKKEKPYPLARRSLCPSKSTKIGPHRPTSPHPSR